MSGAFECPYCEGTGKEGPLVPAMGLYLGTCSFCGGRGFRDFAPRPRQHVEPINFSRTRIDMDRIADFVERNERYL